MFDFTTGTNGTQFYRSWDFALPLKFHRKHPCLTVKDKGFPVQKTWQEQIRSGACPIGGRQERWVDWAPWNKGPYIALHPFHHLPSPNLWIILGETSLFQMLVYIIYLVGGLEHDFFDFPYIGNFIIPTDEVIFFRGVGQPPTRYSGSSPKGWCSSYREVRPLA